MSCFNYFCYWTSGTILCTFYSALIARLIVNKVLNKCCINKNTIILMFFFLCNADLITLIDDVLEIKEQLSNCIINRKFYYNIIIKV